ncbi:MAG: hypothetical protein OXI91_16640 [Chloroflexota bacterium]|nr:hypothetical protein [Chloroflexota bacterium]
MEDLRHLRLMALLDELVRDKGPRRAAADLDVDHRTLTASPESGRLSRRMRTALNQALLAGAGVWSGCATRSGSCRWSWRSWRNTG